MTRWRSGEKMEMEMEMDVEIEENIEKREKRDKGGENA